MKQIAITGGKGGTGKSTVSILLASRLLNQGKKVVLVDADVECPNDYLLLGQSLVRAEKKVFNQYPSLEKSRCRKCRLCAQNCRSHAIFQPQGQLPVFLDELCSGCGLCWHLCPYQAIKIRKKVIGEIFENRLSQNFYLVTGRSKGVVEETGSIVTQARDYGLALALKKGADFLLIDTAVGLHCGVIRALIGADRALAVTEATPLGVHDLKLILVLLDKLRVPVKIVLNQANLGKRELVEGLAKKSKVAIKYELPYSKKIAQAYFQGKLGQLGGFL